MAKSLSHDLRFRGLELVRADDRRHTPAVSQLRERLDALEMIRSPTAIPTQALVDPSAAWSAWTVTQRRELLRLLFAGIAVKHVGLSERPTCRSWATDPSLGQMTIAERLDAISDRAPSASRVVTRLGVFAPANPG